MKVIMVVAVLAAAGAWILWWRSRSLIARSRQWPTAAGSIVQCGTKENPTPAYDEYKYSFILRYSYQVGAQTYECDRERWYLSGPFTYASDDVHDLDAAASYYHLGKPVTVYYDPANPANAVLDPGSSAGADHLIYHLVTAAAIVILLVVFSLIF
jgi:hypothetical protein